MALLMQLDGEGNAMPAGSGKVIWQQVPATALEGRINAVCEELLSIFRAAVGHVIIGQPSGKAIVKLADGNTAKLDVLMQMLVMANVYEAFAEISAVGNDVLVRGMRDFCDGHIRTLGKVSVPAGRYEEVRRMFMRGLFDAISAKEHGIGKQSLQLGKLWLTADDDKPTPVELAKWRAEIAKEKKKK